MLFVFVKQMQVDLIHNECSIDNNTDTLVFTQGLQLSNT